MDKNSESPRLLTSEGFPKSITDREENTRNYGVLSRDKVA